MLVRVEKPDAHWVADLGCGTGHLTAGLLEKFPNAEGSKWLLAVFGGAEIHVSCEDNVNRSATKAHIAYEVSDLEVWRLKLEAAGFEVQGAVPIPGFDRFETRDPFGNRLGLITEE